MQDIFHEQLIKRKPTTKDALIRTAVIVGVFVVFAISMAVIPTFGMIITLVAGFMGYVLMGRLKREYEYSFTNGELDIDVIYNKSSRKRVFNGNVKDFELMAHIDDQAHNNSLASANEKLDYSTGVPSDRSYVFLTNYNSKRVAITIEPNDVILEVMSKALTRRKFYPKKM